MDRRTIKGKADIFLTTFADQQRVPSKEFNLLLSEQIGFHHLTIKRYLMALELFGMIKHENGSVIIFNDENARQKNMKENLSLHS